MKADPHHYYPTPAWFAEQLVERHFAGLGRSSVILEAGCGTGEFLSAIPDGVSAYGIEIDPARAAIAREKSGREVIEGDFLTTELPLPPTDLLGNPPFSAKVIDAFLGRAHAVLPSEGQVGWIIPAYLFQTANRVVGYQDRWSIAVEQIPRNIFPRIRLPLTFAIFTKNHERRLVGLALYGETAAWLALDEKFRAILARGRPPVWRSFVEAALAQLGGEASLQDLYRAIAPRRPTANPFWQEKIRQVCQQHFRRVAEGVYRLTEPTGARAA